MIKYLLALTLLAFSIANPATAKILESAGGIAAVNMEYVLQNSVAAKDLQARAEVMQAKHIKEVETKGKELQVREKDLLKKRENATAQAFEEKVAEFQRDVDGFQRQDQDFNAKLTEAFNQSLSKIHSTIIEIVSGLAKEKKYSVVFSQNDILYVNPAIDITEVVVSALNQRLKSVELHVKSR